MVAPVVSVTSTTPVEELEHSPRSLGLVRELRAAESNVLADHESDGFAKQGQTIDKGLESCMKLWKALESLIGERIVNHLHTYRAAAVDLVGDLGNGITLNKMMQSIMCSPNMEPLMHLKKTCRGQEFLNIKPMLLEVEKLKDQIRTLSVDTSVFDHEKFQQLIQHTKETNKLREANTKILKAGFLETEGALAAFGSLMKLMQMQSSGMNLDATETTLNHPPTVELMSMPRLKNFYSTREVKPWMKEWFFQERQELVESADVLQEVENEGQDVLLEFLMTMSASVHNLIRLLSNHIERVKVVKSEYPPSQHIQSVVDGLNKTFTEYEDMIRPYVESNQEDVLKLKDMMEEAENDFNEHERILQGYLRESNYRLTANAAAQKQCMKNMEPIINELRELEAERAAEVEERLKEYNRLVKERENRFMKIAEITSAQRAFNQGKEAWAVALEYVKSMKKVGAQLSTNTLERHGMGHQDLERSEAASYRYWQRSIDQFCESFTKYAKNGINDKLFTISKLDLHLKRSADNLTEDLKGNSQTRKRNGIALMQVLLALRKDNVSAINTILNEMKTQVPTDRDGKSEMSEELMDMHEIYSKRVESVVEVPERYYELSSIDNLAAKQYDEQLSKKGDLKVVRRTKRITASSKQAAPVVAVKGKTGVSPEYLKSGIGMFEQWLALNEKPTKQVVPTNYTSLLDELDDLLDDESKQFAAAWKPGIRDRSLDCGLIAADHKESFLASTSEQLPSLKKYLIDNPDIKRLVHDPDDPYEAGKFSRIAKQTVHSMRKKSFVSLIGTQPQPISARSNKESSLDLRSARSRRGSMYSELEVAPEDDFFMGDFTGIEASLEEIRIKKAQPKSLSNVIDRLNKRGQL